MQLLQILLQSAETTQEVAKETGKISSWSHELAKLPLDKALEKLIDGSIDLVAKLVVAAIVFYIGKFIINRIYKSIRMIMLRKQVDRSLSTFILSVLKVTLLFILIIIVISILGIQTSSFIALFASAGVAIGMALSGTLQNFAGGVLILLLKPYKVGDYIEVQGFTGTVKEIQIFNTLLNTLDNKCIFIPNGSLSTGSIKNYSSEDYRRVDWTVTISYGNDYDVAKRAILDLLESDDRIVKQYIEDDRAERHSEVKAENTTEAAGTENATGKPEKESWVKRISNRHRRHVEAIQQRITANAPKLPKVDRSPFVALDSLSSSSVDLAVRVWVPAAYYWDVYYSINERIYKELPKAGISFPFPQMDVHLVRPE